MSARLKVTAFKGPVPSVSREIRTKHFSRSARGQTTTKSGLHFGESILIGSLPKLLIASNLSTVSAFDRQPNGIFSVRLGGPFRSTFKLWPVDELIHSEAAREKYGKGKNVWNSLDLL